MQFSNTSSESTDIALFVKTSSDAIVQWDKQAIVDALLKETLVDNITANKIAQEVEEIINQGKVKIVTAPLIREIVNMKLVEYNLDDARRIHTRLGVPVYDVDQMMTSPNKENANIPHGPEATNLILAEIIKKEYALLMVFNQEIADAHMIGDMHLHDLGFVERPYTYDGNECIIVRKEDYDEVLCLSFKNLFNLCDFTYDIPEDDVTIGVLYGYFVLDKDSWTPIEKIVKRKKTHQMYWVKTINSRSLIVTNNHPFLIKDDDSYKRVEVQNLQKGQQVHTLKKISIDQNITSIDLSSIKLTGDTTNRLYYVDGVVIELPGGEKRVLNDISVDKLNELRKLGYVHDLSKSIIYSKSLGGQNKSHSLSTIFELTEDFCYFVGLFIAEGNYEPNTITINTDKSLIDKIIPTIENMGFSYTLSSKENGVYSLRIYSSILNDLFRNYFKIGSLSRNINLPIDCLSWEPKLSFSLLSGLIDGDGTVSSGNILIRTSSRQMLEQVSWLLLTQGIKSCDRKNGGIGSVRYYKGKKIVQNYDIFGVSFYTNSNCSHLFHMSKKCKDIRFPTREYIKDVDYIRDVQKIETQDDYIYDITTSSGTFICNGIYSSNCSGQSLEYIKKFGLSLPNSLALAKPAKHPEVLLAHMVKFSAALQCNFAGAIGWDAVNLFFAPYLEELSDKQINQLAQMLIFEFSQQAVARGGQAIFSDINLYWEVPKHFENVLAIGPGGTYTGKTYGEYTELAQKFIWALFDVYLEGDASGRPFFFPKPLVHITEKFFITPGHQEFLNHICRVASEKGNTYFVFDRGSTAKISECCRLSFKLDANDLADANTPWKMRYSALQNVTINLPRIAYKANRDNTKLFQLLSHYLQLASKAHRQKYNFIKRLIDQGANSPLSMLTMNQDGEGYLRLHKASFLMGMVGLNEMVEYHTGKQLHESEEAFLFGLEVIAHMKLVSDKLSHSEGLKFVLEQTPAESTAYRFAKLDLQLFPQSKKVIKGNLDTGEIYYTNSTLFNVSANVNPVTRVKQEGLFHPLIEAGSITHVWLGESQPSPESLANFVTKTFKQTKNDQIAFSPEFTTCLDCNKTVRGLVDQCPYCGSFKIEGITRITGYFTKVSSWNKGKLGELKDRFRNNKYFNQ